MFGDETKSRKVVVKAFSWGPIWCMGWLFTIGLGQLSFSKAVLGIIIWPYYIGTMLR